MDTLRQIKWEIKLEKKFGLKLFEQGDRQDIGHKIPIKLVHKQKSDFFTE